MINDIIIWEFSPSETWDYDLSRVQHLPYRFAGFRNLRSPSPSIMYPYEFARYYQDRLPRRPICPPEHGRYYPVPLSPRYTINPIYYPPPNYIYVSPNKRLPQKRKIISKLARRRGVMIEPSTGQIQIVKRRTHADIKKSN
ncbi:unnamed protein product [Onchocerca flexuosa]|uniref:Nuclear transcription factor Y subunit n=2 Tax=Onchocerca flexuosa TaxID=387005 RepID=A0A183HSR9_9BILA|nr:unnamed protein product [Onchocerca flexuosa]